MAEALGVAGSVIAIVDVSAKITKLCSKYYKEVRDARESINNLQGRASQLKDTLERLDKLVNGKDGATLKTSKPLQDSLTSCLNRLQEVVAKLEMGQSQRSMRRFGRRAFEWPFKADQLKTIIGEIDSCQGTFNLALDVEQMHQLVDLNRKVDVVVRESQKIQFSQLPTAKGASYDSQAEEYNARCLKDTRVELLKRIHSWAEGTDSRSIFWLNGMAGTGKSTIARTVAHDFALRKKLGASFFFRRGEADRNTGAKLFPTIATQLANVLPELETEIRQAIEKDPLIADKALKIQFEELLLNPLSSLDQQSLPSSKLIVVIDALDECDSEDQIRAILHHLSRAKDLRLLLTSRPELPIRLGFKRMETDTYHIEKLHEVPRQQIEHDITLFLRSRFSEVGRDRDLPQDWASDDSITALASMAIPLFIFAATACRFVANGSDPIKQLERYLKFQIRGQITSGANIYLPVLTQLLDNEENGYDGDGNQTQLQDFQEAVGTIILLQTPLSLTALSALLDLPEHQVRCRLDRLHSVLYISNDPNAPIRTLHLSFRDFLLDPGGKGAHFKVNGKERHRSIASQCLKLLSKRGSLRENICDLPLPSTLRADVDRRDIDRKLPSHVQYACRYWVYHLEQSETNVNDNNDEVHNFLQNHLLGWLEALSLMGNAGESIHMINSLLSMAKTSQAVLLLDFATDIRRFVLANRWIMDHAPLQIYSSALIFAPERSLVRREFENRIPNWISAKPKVQTMWSATLQTLEAHESRVYSVSYSPQGKTIATAGWDKRIIIWDTATGKQMQTFEGDDWFNSVSFSPEGRLVAAGDHAGGVSVWDMTTGAQLRMWNQHMNAVNCVTFSPDPRGSVLASASDDDNVILWDLDTNAEPRTLAGHTEGVNSVAFLLDGAQLASSSYDGTIRFWDVLTGAQLRLLNFSGPVRSVASSYDDTLLAGAVDAVESWQIIVLDTATGNQKLQFRAHDRTVRSLVFSPDGSCIASASRDGTVGLWAADTGKRLQTLTGHASSVNHLAFSPDGTQLASASDDRSVRLWDASAHIDTQLTHRHTRTINSIAVSPDGARLASGSSDNTIRIWDASTAEQLTVHEGHNGLVRHAAWSLDGSRLASASRDRTVRIWDASTGEQLTVCEGHGDWVNYIVWSLDGSQLASASDDKTVRIWDASTGEQLMVCKGHTSWVECVVWSLDGSRLASASHDKTVRIWDASTGVQLCLIKAHEVCRQILAISSSSNKWILCLKGGGRLWDVTSQNGPDIADTVSLPRYDSTKLSREEGRQNQSDPPTTCSQAQDIPLEPLSVDEGCWVMYNGDRLLWLPLDYRPATYETRGNMICLGSESGNVISMKLGRPERHISHSNT